jgi:hypothetical protein
MNLRIDKGCDKGCDKGSWEELLALRTSGIYIRNMRAVRSLAGLSFCDDIWLFHDPAVEAPQQLAPDHVLGIKPAALTLANLTVRPRGGWALDVGTGCGVAQEEHTSA